MLGPSGSRQASGPTYRWEANEVLAGTRIDELDSYLVDVAEEPAGVRPARPVTELSLDNLRLRANLDERTRMNLFLADFLADADGCPLNRFHDEENMPTSEIRDFCTFDGDGCQQDPTRDCWILLAQRRAATQIAAELENVEQEIGHDATTRR